MVCILLVEDESEIRDMLVEVLHDAGFQTVEATTGDAAAELLALDTPSLIVTDINLPGQLDGFDLAVSARKAHPSIPIIFISGWPAKLEQARALGHPAAFLQKPFTFNSLVSAIAELERG